MGVWPTCTYKCPMFISFLSDDWNTCDFGAERWPVSANVNVMKCLDTLDGFCLSCATFSSMLNPIDFRITTSSPEFICDTGCMVLSTLTAARYWAISMRMLTQGFCEWVGGVSGDWWMCLTFVSLIKSIKFSFLNSFLRGVVGLLSCWVTIFACLEESRRFTQKASVLPLVSHQFCNARTWYVINP